MNYTEIIFYVIQVIITVAGGYIGLLIKDNMVFLYILTAVVVLDYITGIIRAGKEKKLSSGVGADGIVKKVVIFLLIGLANLLDIWILGEDSVLRTATIFFYLLSELISFMDNLIYIGLPFPKKLKLIFSILHHRE